ncbi:MAG: thioesterase family protein [Acidimicrobiia bacterium]
MHEFDDDTKVEPSGEGLWRGTVTDRWNIGRAPNGGYLLAIGLAALERALPHPHPVTATAHYLRRTEPGGVDIEVETVRRGTSLSTGQAKLVQEGRERVRLLATYRDLSSLQGATAVSVSPPELPAPDQLPSSARAPGLPTVAERFDLRLTPGSVSWALGARSGVAEVQGWVRFADGREPDVRSLAVFADAMPPAVMNIVEAGWVPTIELTVQVRGIPASGWLSCRFSTRFLIGGYLEEDGEVWDSRGRLVALSRQLARVNPPRLSRA